MTIQPRQQAGTPNGAGGQFAQKNNTEADDVIAGPTTVGKRSVPIPGRLKRHPDVDATFYENGLIGLETENGYVEFNTETLDKLIEARAADQKARRAAQIYVGLRVDTNTANGRGEVVLLKQNNEFAEVKLDDRGRVLSYPTDRLSPAK